MRFLRIKIDVATLRFQEATRDRIRGYLRDLFCRSIPARRLWIYLKGLRQMSLGSPEESDKMDAECFDGPEDVIVKGIAPLFVVYSMIAELRAVNHLVRPECLGLLLHFTVMQDIQHRLMPGLSPSSDFTLDERGLERLQKITHLAFASGKTRTCNACGSR